MKGLTSLVLTLLVLLAMGCATNDQAASRIAQGTVMKRGIESVPPYVPSSYPAREDINWYLRQTEERATWYVYALSMDGRPMFYVVSDMKPRNICISITAPDRKVTGPVVMSAPALDGVYYGGAGCDAYYLRDVTTGNFIELAGQTFSLIASKVPLQIETDWGRLEATEAEQDEPS